MGQDAVRGMRCGDGQVPTGGRVDGAEDSASCVLRGRECLRLRRNRHRHGQQRALALHDQLAGAAGPRALPRLEADAVVKVLVVVAGKFAEGIAEHGVAGHLLLLCREQQQVSAGELAVVAEEGRRGSRVVQCWPAARHESHDTRK